MGGSGKHNPAQSTSATVIRWRVWLVDSEPPIWRCFQVGDDCTLADLHRVIQQVMGWENRHPYRFVVRGDRYGDPQQLPTATDPDAAQVTLAQLALQVGDRMTYHYDFQDGWLHLLTVEGIVAPSESTPTPHCLEGDRACPPETCGGIWGYEEVLERFNDPEDPDYLELLDWLGNFDPDAFDRDQVNQRLRSLTS